MASNIASYVPILRAKQSEFLAIAKLAEGLGSKFTPFFEIRQMGYYEKQKMELEDHLRRACKNICKYWPKESAFFIDVYGIGNSEVKSKRSPGDVRRFGRIRRKGAGHTYAT